MRTKRPEASFAPVGREARHTGRLLFAGVILGAAAMLFSSPTGVGMGSQIVWADPAPATSPAAPNTDKTPTIKAAPARTATVPSAPAPKTAPVKTPVAPAGKVPAAPSSALNPAATSTTHATQSTTTRTASARPGAVTMRAAATPVLNGTTVHAAPSVPRAHLEDRIAYQYNALGRRDPFQPLIDGGYVGVDVGGSAPPDVGGIKVVGIVWGESDKFALVEDARGNSLVLRPGDKVMNGVVSGLKRDALLVSITVDGLTESVAIPLTRKGESNGNR